MLGGKSGRKADPGQVLREMRNARNEKTTNGMVIKYSGKVILFKTGQEKEILQERR